jgi:hypothetical protein
MRGLHVILVQGFFATVALCSHSGGAESGALKPPGQLAMMPASTRPQLPVGRYGAIGDGKAKDTAAIQRAIDAAGAIGGGTVGLPPGRYLSGGLVVRSGVTLRLDAGATLLASTEVSDYPVVMPAFRSSTNSTGPVASLIYGEGLHDVGIAGEGVIDGQGAAFAYGSGRVRPRLLNLVTCRGVCVEGVTLRNAPGWVQHYLACDDLVIHGIRVYSHANYNNDMMDIDCCRNVRISDCIGDTGDDGVTLKSTADRPCENITITNCVLSSHCNALKLGTESNGGFKNIAISNCVICPSESREIRHGAQGGLAGIALEMVDGGVLDRVAISNVTMRGVKSPLFLRLGNRARPFVKDGPRPGIGVFRNVTISNILATDASEIGCAIVGLPERSIENVTLSGIMLSFAGGGTNDHAAATVLEKPEAYPECTMFGVLPAYGFYCRSVSGLTFSNVDVRWTKPDLRPAMVCDDVQDLRVDGLKGQSAADGAPVIILNDVRGAMLRGCVAPRDARVFLRMQGTTGKVSAMSNDLSAAALPFEFAAPAAAEILYQMGNRFKD